MHFTDQIGTQRVSQQQQFLIRNRSSRIEKLVGVMLLSLYLTWFGIRFQIRPHFRRSSRPARRPQSAAVYTPIFIIMIREVAIHCVLYCIECSCVVLSMVTRDALFLRSWDCYYIPLLTLLLSVVPAISSIMQQRIVERLGHRSYLFRIIFPSVSGLVVAAFWILREAKKSEAALSLMFYVWAEVYVQLLIPQFWDHCSQTYDVRQSKKYFGFITYGSTLGTLSTGAFLIPYLQKLNFPTIGNLLIVAGELQAIAIVFYTERSVSPQQSASKLVSNSTANADRGEIPSSVWKEIWLNQYLQHICLFEVIASVVRVLIDFQTLRFFSKYDEDILKSSLGMINVIQSVLMIPLQLLASYVFTRYGVMYGVATLPLAIFCFGFVTSFSEVSRSSVYVPS